MVGEVVVVFDWLEGRGFAVEAEVVDWDGFGEERLEGYMRGCVSWVGWSKWSVQVGSEGSGGNWWEVPWVRAVRCGAYLLSCRDRIGGLGRGRLRMGRGSVSCRCTRWGSCPYRFVSLSILFNPSGELVRYGIEHTVPPSALFTLEPSASHPIIRAISLTRAFVSREVVEADRSWESFAWRQGCLETWTLAGRGDILFVERGVRWLID